MVLRVAHLLPNLVTGGRERMVVDLCAVASASDIEPVIISYDPDAPGRRLGAPDVAEHHLDRRGGDFDRRLRRRLTELQIDILHAQGHISAGLAGSTMRELPSIATIHIALGGGWRWLPSIVRGLRNAGAVTAVSEDLGRRFRPWAGKAVSITPPGVDIQRFSLAQKQTTGEPFTVGMAARLHPVKRHLDAVAAIRILAEQGQSCRLLLAGQGPEEPRLRQASVGLDIHFCGDVADVPAWLAQLDAFVLPSDHEGTPLALLEALAAGIPAVATAVGGVPALVRDAAVLVPRRNPQLLAREIKNLMTDIPHRQKLAEKGRSRASSFSIAQAGETMAGLYRALC